MSLNKASIVFLLLGFILTSCSSGEQEQASSTDSMAEFDTMEMLDDFGGDDLFALDGGFDEDFAAFGGDDDLVFTEEVFEDDSALDGVEFSESSDDAMWDQMWQEQEQKVEKAQKQDTSAFAPVIRESAAGSSSSYTVQSGDTLMYIAYKKYGDYSEWRSLASLNGLSGSYTRLSAGQQIKLDPSKVRVVPELKGRAYLIRRGDSLSRISMNEYGTYQRWNDLWQHNSAMIKDPNLIFAGFQMRLLPDQTIAMNW